MNDRDKGSTVDIGIDKGRIATIESRLLADGKEIDLGGRLTTPGFIETHIHLDKSCILDRCHSDIAEYFFTGRGPYSTRIHHFH